MDRQSPSRNSKLGQRFQTGFICLFVAVSLSFPTASVGQSSSDRSQSSAFKQLERFGSSLKQTADPNSKLELLASPEDEIEGTTAHFSADRINSIHDRIKLIKKLMEDEKASTEKTNPQHEEFGQPIGATVAQAEPVSPQPATQSETPEHPAIPKPVLPDPKPGDGLQIPTIAETGTVVTEPINSFELANSLFLTGNFKAARRSYEGRLKEKTTPDEALWLKCLIGCCYRLEGDAANAETIFREVSNSNTAAYPVDYAIWNLKYLAQRRASQEAFQSIETELEAILAEVKNHE